MTTTPRPSAPPTSPVGAAPAAAHATRRAASAAFAAPTPTSPPRVPRPLLAGALAASALAAALGLLAPRLPLIGEGIAETMLGDMLGAGTAALVLALTALVGAAAGIAALVGLLPRPALLGVTAVEVLVAGVGLGSMSTLSTAGYLLALAMPVILALLLIQTIRRYPRLRLPLSAAAVLGVGAGTVVLGAPLRELLGYLLPAFAAELPLIGFTLLMVAVGALWSAAAVLDLRGSATAARATAWVTRHRVALTVLAACGPLPYALIRLTWLTPWPLLGTEQAMDLSTRLWGLALSSGSWLAVILTIGLIRPWGEVFPRWMPVVAGRPVPIAAAAVPGGAVAALLSFAAVPLLVGAAAQGQGAGLVLAFAIIFPCWLWGPALALAVWGYVGHRRDQQRREAMTDVPGAGTA